MNDFQKQNESGQQPEPTWRTQLMAWVVPIPRGEAGKRGVFRFYAKRILLFYLAICLMLAAFQRSLLYFPSKEAISAEEAHFRSGQVHDVTTTTADVITLHGWHILPNADVAANREECDTLLKNAAHVVLYFSGNAANRKNRSEDFRAFTTLGAHVFVFDYRGYGENEGTPSEAGLVADSEAAWNYVVEQRNVDPARLVIFGESLGGGVAVQLAARKCRQNSPPAGLALRSTFSSIADTAAYHYPWLPVRLLLVDHFDSYGQVPDVTCPLVHIHGSRDKIVPIGLGKKLFRNARPTSKTGVEKRFVELPQADHNDVLYVAEKEFREAIRMLLRNSRTND